MYSARAGRVHFAATVVGVLIAVAAVVVFEISAHILRRLT